MTRLTICLLALQSLVTIGASEVSAEQGTRHKLGTQAEIRVEDPAKCTICGMDRRMFAYSRALVTFEDGTEAGACSIGCAREAVEKQSGKKVRTIQVADYNVKKLLNAKESVWVIGGSKQGVMTSTAKWAFADRAAAKMFVKGFGGRVTGFDEVWKSAAD